MRYDYQKLKAARLAKLLTQSELAHMTGLSVSAINMVELGKGPWIKAIRMIAAILKVRDVVIPDDDRVTK